MEKVNILVVDDNTSFLGVVKTTLSKGGNTFNINRNEYKIHLIDEQITGYNQLKLYLESDKLFPDFILLDWNFETNEFDKTSGEEILKILMNRKRQAWIASKSRIDSPFEKYKNLEVIIITSFSRGNTLKMLMNGACVVMERNSVDKKFTELQDSIRKIYEKTMIDSDVYIPILGRTLEKSLIVQYAPDLLKTQQYIRGITHEYTTYQHPKVKSLLEKNGKDYEVMVCIAKGMRNGEIDNVLNEKYRSDKTVSTITASQAIIRIKSIFEIDSREEIPIKAIELGVPEVINFYAEKQITIINNRL